MSLISPPNQSAVDTSSCSTLINTTKPFILTLKKGENLFAGILKCASEVNLKAAIISGLGALDDVTVAYYHLETKEYQTKLFTGMFELISLNGNITMVDGKHFIHIHAALGTSEYDVIGGHIMDAIVGPTAEIAITPLENTITREYNADIGLKLICPGFEGTLK